MVRPGYEYEDGKGATPRRSSTLDVAFELNAARKGTKGLNRLFSVMNEDDHRVTALHPMGRFRVFIEVLGLAFLANDLVISPYIVAWDVAVNLPIVIMMWSSMSYWTLEMGLNFVTGYYSHGELQTQLLAVSRHYLRGTFCIDFFLVCCDVVSVVTHYTLISSAASPSVDTLSLVRLTKFTRLLRISALLRLGKLTSAISKMQLASLSDNKGFILQVLRFLFATIFINHLLCCLWFVIGQWAPSDTGSGWLDATVKGPVCGAYEECKFSEASPFYQYMLAFHWSIAQVTLGSMEVVPSNSYERAFNILLLFFGVLFASTIVSSFSTLAMQLMMKRQDRVEKTARLRTFLVQHKVRSRLAVRVLRQVHEKSPHKPFMYEHNVDTLSLLSADLREELFCAIRKPHLNTHCVFRLWTEIDTTAVEMICHEAVTFLFFGPGDEVFRPEVEALSAYHAVKGSLEYVQDPRSSVVDDFETTAVGVGSWVSEAAWWTRWTHVGRLTAHQATQLLVVEAKGVFKVAESRPVIIGIAKTYARMFHSHLVASTPPHAPWPNDLHLEIHPADFVDVRVGIRLLDQLTKRGNLLLTDAQKLKLHKELEAGTCGIHLAASSELERVCFLSLLRISDEFGRILAQVRRTDKKGALVTELRLPGAKRAQGELPQEALQRLLDSMGDLAESLELTHTEREVVDADSASVGIRTTYIQTTHFAALCDDAPQRMILVSAGGTQMRQSGISGPGRLSTRLGRKFITPDLFAISGKESTSLFAWLQPEEFHMLRGSSGEKALADWLSSHNHDLQGLNSSAANSSRFSKSMLLTDSSPCTPSALAELPACGEAADVVLDDAVDVAVDENVRELQQFRPTGPARPHYRSPVAL